MKDLSNMNPVERTDHWAGRLFRAASETSNEPYPSNHMLYVRQAVEQLILHVRSLSGYRKPSVEELVGLNCNRGTQSRRRHQSPAFVLRLRCICQSIINHTK